jgi:hypothetical protein
MSSVEKKFLAFALPYDTCVSRRVFDTHARVPAKLQMSEYIPPLQLIETDHGPTAKTVPFPAVPPAEAVPKRTPLELNAKAATGNEPSPFWPEKLWSTLSAHVPDGVDGGASLNTVPQPGI